MTLEAIAALIFGLGLVAGYLWLGVFCAKQTWGFTSALRQMWARVVLVSAVVVLFFMPGLIGAGHGVGIGPAWLMFATGTFWALTPTSKLMFVAATCAVWVAVFAVGLLITRRKGNS